MTRLIDIRVWLVLCVAIVVTMESVPLDTEPIPADHVDSNWLDVHQSRIRLLRNVPAGSGEDGDNDSDDDDDKDGGDDDEGKTNIDNDLKSDEDDSSDSDQDDDNKSKDNDDDDDEDEFKSQADKKLLILLIDGVRHDYIQRDPALKGFERMAKQGVMVSEVRPVHPSNLYPNQYSIVTGVYPERHGFVDDFVRDRSSGEVFAPGSESNVSSAHWWTQAEPVWATAEKHRVKAALYGWNGACQVVPENKKKWPHITVCEPQQPTPLTSAREKQILQERLDRIVADFQEHRYRLAFVYYQSISRAGEKYGPQSRITKQEVRDLDSILYKLQDRLVHVDLDDEVNVYVVSTHGMLSSKKIKPIKLDQVVDMNDVELVLGMGSSVQVLAEKDKHEQLYRQLVEANVKGLNVYRRSTVPKRMHIGASRNLLPIYLTADQGYYIDTPDITGKVYPDLDEDNLDDEIIPKGVHGYDPKFVPEMNTLMYAFGPDIQDQRKLDKMNQVDHYNVFCELLGLKPKKNDGSAEVAKNILQKYDTDDSVEDGDDSDENDDDSDEDKKDDDDEDDDNGTVATSVSNWTVILGICWILFWQH